MRQYTDLTGREIHALADQYNLELTCYEPIERGAGSSNYLLWAGEWKYVLTVFEISRARVMKMCGLVSWLEMCRYPTTRLLELDGGGVITEARGKPVIIKPYIRGRVVEDLNEGMLFQAGDAMRRLHEIEPPDDLPHLHAYGLATFGDVVGRGIDSEYEDWLAEMTIFLEGSIPPGLPRALIHGDMFFDNLLFEGEELSAVLDFEEACRYYRVFDLGMGIVGMCRNGSRISLDKVSALLSGYRHYGSLEPEEIEHLQLFTVYAAAATSKYRFWKYNIDTPMPEHAHLHREMMEAADNALRIPEGKFSAAIMDRDGG